MLLVPSHKQSIGARIFPNTVTRRIQTPPDLSQTTKGLDQKMGILVPQRDVSQTPRMHRHMENPNIGPRDLISCFGIQDTVFQTPRSKISTSHPGIGSGFNPYFSGSERTASKRGCQNYALYKRRVLQPTVSCPKKGWTSASGDRSECSKQVHFQMENLSFLKTLLLPGDYMTNIDLKDAYLSVAVHENSQKFLSFIWEEKCYQFKALPFGLCSAPRTFTKLLKPVAAFLRKKGIRVLIYLDDFLLLAQTKEEATRNTQMLVALLQSLGFTVNLKKSSLTPTQMITFLGFNIDSRSLIIALPVTKVQKIMECCQNLTTPPTVILRSVASLIGLLESCRPAIWRSPLHFRHLQMDLIEGLQMNQGCYDSRIALSRGSKKELDWWLENTPSINNSPVHLPPPDLVITTDASKKGWGAVHQSLKTNGKWSEQESLQHINYLELKAAFLALKSFLKGKSHLTVSLRLDNTTAIAYINNKGGTRSPQLLTLALELWDWCQTNDI